MNRGLEGGKGERPVCLMLDRGRAPGTSLEFHLFRLCSAAYIPLLVGELTDAVGAGSSGWPGLWLVRSLGVSASRGLPYAF